MTDISFHSLPRRVLGALLLLAVTAVSLRAQDGRSAEDHPWFLGIEGGTSFGQATFRSITEDQIHWGIQGGLSGGYRFNRLLSLEAVLQYGGQSQSALDCCAYWLSDDGQRYLSPVLDGSGAYYADLLTRTQWGKLALQANLDLLSLVTRPGARWSLEVSPQIAAVTTRTRLVKPTGEQSFGRQWHLGLGGQAALGYQISERIGVALYGGISSLSGERFDNIPEHVHKSNLIWDAGVKLRYGFGQRRGRAQAEAEAAAAAEAARLAAEREAAERQAAEATALAAQRAEQERLAREAAARAEQERLEREAALAAAEKEEAFNTPIETVYFPFDSKQVLDNYDPSLEAALAILQKYPDFKLEIHAYCSRSGSPAYNKKLSERRMEAVRTWFVEHGIPMERMQKAYFHGIDYQAPSAAKARRAELKFVK